MSIPGLQLPGLALESDALDTASFSAPAVPEQRDQALAANTEYRFEVPFSRTVHIKLVNGTAELFGSELAQNRDYHLSGVKAAIFTYDGCTIQITGKPESEYVSEETEMAVAANVHFALEGMRDDAAGTGRYLGPRVLLIGPEDSGKTTLMRILTSYAVKMDRQPIVVNMNPREGLLGVPGSFTATAFADILDIEAVGGWGSSPISGPSATPVKMPLVYQYGCGSADENKPVYKALATRLALAVTSRLEEDDEVRSSGCLIDTPGNISSGKGGSYELIQHIVSEFSINVVIVIGPERLYKDMTRLYSFASDGDEPVSVVRIAKSEGCAERDETYMRELRHAQVRNYFFGSPAASLSPHTQMVDFNHITLYKVRSASDNSSFNPGAGDDDDDYDPSSFGMGSSSIYDRIAPGPMLQNSLLTITTAGANESQEGIRDSSVLGYMYVAEVDESKKKLRLLSPISGRVPANAVVVGDWPEGIMDLME